jgi:tRNA-splicing ligase RtcB
MFYIQGTYTTAHVMIDSIDDATHKQILSFCDDPMFEGQKIVIQADCHLGVGSCIGFTSHIGERINPNLVGVDIGCGVYAVKTNLTEIDLVTFDNFIKQNIPSGFSIHKSPLVDSSALAKYKEVATKLDIDFARVACSIGTLGQGNHYLELDKGKDGFIWINIHSGSRNFGLQVANYHSKKAVENSKGMNCIPFLNVNSSEGQEYLSDQKIAVEYADDNRCMMMLTIQKYLQNMYRASFTDAVISVHNFIDKNGMIRKGATSANKDERLIIPFNMRDGLAICRGKGNPDFNNSAPHGAGRILSRSKAKQTLDVEFFKEDMKQAGVYTTTANASTLDESPDAYKDFNMILAAIQETVTVDEMVKPVYNFKAGGE